ncbi:hypothetical protein CDES_05535 [Corynebacterium deserti GIMN1.010]|uniref:Uncharacterized protein n=1 Tax=Corynebacterium deserti GIMN1.010 TaxID=931089 RepID=A0A0M5ITY9_9CORY|nr:hypothetical protein CDES_05535 [Corynebacterium deserti GIMN1.010]
MVGSFSLSKANAQSWIDLVANMPRGFGFDFTAQIYRSQPISDRVMEVIASSIEIHTNLIGVYSVPFESCLAGVPIGGDSGDENNSIRGSSFGSS